MNPEVEAQITALVRRIDWLRLTPAERTKQVNAMKLQIAEIEKMPDSEEERQALIDATEADIQEIKRLNYGGQRKIVGTANIKR